MDKWIPQLLQDNFNTTIAVLITHLKVSTYYNGTKILIQYL